MVKKTKKIAVTGGCGRLAYSLLFAIANGEMLGKEQPIDLHILESATQSEKALKGLNMEIEDCAFPLLNSFKISTDPYEVFQEADFALLVGAKPRGPGMERKDLLLENGKIFVEQGKALNEVASKNVKVLVVGNPCNTNCLIAMHHAPKIPHQNFHALMRLDQNRAVAQLALKAGVLAKDVRNVAIWGNHSSTQVVDFYHATIDSKKVKELLDLHWLETEFLSVVQKRGSAVIDMLGKSSAASAAKAVLDAIISIITPTVQNEWFSDAICSDNNTYGIASDLIFSFPCKTDKNGKISIVTNLEINEILQKKIKLSEKELLEERELVAHLINT